MAVLGVPYPVELLTEEAQLFGYPGAPVAIQGDQLVIGQDGAVLFKRENETWHLQGTISVPGSMYHFARVALDGNTLVRGSDGSGAEKVQVFVTANEPGLNAWNVTDNSLSTGVFYHFDKPLSDADRQLAAAEGWTLTIRARMADNFGYTGSPACFVDFAFTPTNRFIIWFGLDADDLTVRLNEGTPLSLTSNGQGWADYHEHQLVFNSANGTADYYFDGVKKNPAPLSPVAVSPLEGVRFGTGASGGEGSMNFNRVELQTLLTHQTLALYNAGEGGNPAVAPSPETQGWTLWPGNPGAGKTQGAVSPDLLTVWRLQAVLTPSDPGSGDGFGQQVAISGDTVVVGASYNDDEGANTGSAYVFTRNGTNWTQQQKLAPSVRAASDYFGLSVAVDGDSLVVGSPHQNSSSANTYPGAAFVFVRNGEVWTEQQRLVANDAAAGDAFGGNVAIDGDRIAVGALYDDRGANKYSGSVYIFDRNGATWSQQGYLTPNDSPYGESFGQSLGLKGDLVAASGPYYEQAYVFVRGPTAWSEPASILFTNIPSPSVNAIALDGPRVVVSVGQIEGSEGAIYIFRPDFSQPGPLVDYARKLLYYSAGGGSSIYRPEDAAFRYKDLLYGVSTNGNLRARFETTTNYYGQAERDLAAFAEGEVLKGLSFHPDDAGLGNLLLDIHYDRAAAEAILAGELRSRAEKARFGPPLAPSAPASGFIIDNEIPLYRQLAASNAVAMQGYFDLLKLDLEEQVPGAPTAQWATQVLGFSTEFTTNSWSAAKALGPPDVFPLYGDYPGAWASLTSDGQREYLELGFANPAYIDSVSIYETLAPGAVDTVSVRNPANGLYEAVWTGTAAAAGTTSRVFTVSFPLTSYPVDAVRLDLNSPAVADWNEIDAVGISGPGTPTFITETNFGYHLFQDLVPMRGLMPATYYDTNGVAHAVTTNGAALFSGYKDLVLLFNLLRDHGRAAESLARLLIARQNPGDLEEATNVVSQTQRAVYLQGSLLKSLFPVLPPENDPSGLAQAISGWSASITALQTLEQTLAGRGNVLGFADDFMMYVQKFTGQSSDFFDSYDALNVRLDPTGGSNPLRTAQERFQLALSSYAAYEGSQDQLAEHFQASSITYEDRLRDIVGVFPGDPSYSDTPTQNPGSELDQQYQSIQLSRLRIQKNDTEIKNLNARVQIEINKAVAISNAVIRFGEKQEEITKTIGHINAAQEGMKALSEALSPERIVLAPQAVFGAVNTVAQAGAEEAKGQLEAQKERVAALQQATITGIESDAAVKTMLLEMNTLLLDSQEAALLLRQELNRMVGLYREKADLEQKLSERDQNLAERFFADPIHRLTALTNMVSSDLAFNEAQKWLFYLTRALEYKWNTPLAFYEYPAGSGHYWSGSTIFKLRNAEELVGMYDAMDDFDSQAQPPRGFYSDWFSVREDFFGYKYTNSLGQVLEYPDPITGQPVGAVQAFRSHLRQLQDVSGNINIDFSTVRELPASTFFRWTALAQRGSCPAKVCFSTKSCGSRSTCRDTIPWASVNSPANSPTAAPVSSATGTLACSILSDRTGSPTK